VSAREFVQMLGIVKRDEILLEQLDE